MGDPEPRGMWALGGRGLAVWEGYWKQEGVKVCPCATGPGSKRLGIDGDREAVPLTLQIIYSKVRPLLGPGFLGGLLLTHFHPESAPLHPQAPVFQLGGCSHLPGRKGRE